MFKRNLLASAVAGCGMAVSAIPALAQTEGAALEEVVVTATRRAESAQDVPIPVTAISGDKIERAYAQDVRDQIMGLLKRYRDAGLGNEPVAFAAGSGPPSGVAGLSGLALTRLREVRDECLALERVSTILPSSRLRGDVI